MKMQESKALADKLNATIDQLLSNGQINPDLHYELKKSIDKSAQAADLYALDALKIIIDQLQNAPI